MRNVIPGIAIVLAGMLAAGCSREQKKTETSSKPPEPILVQTAAAQTRVIDRSIAVTGSLNADESVAVSAEVPGRVSAIYVDFGQPVKKGQVVAELDKQELQFAMDRAKASLTQALARLGLEANQESTSVESTPSIRQAKAQLDDAKSKYDNASRLVKTGDIAQERFTEIEKQYQARQAVYEAAKDEARTLQASVQALRAELKLAQKRLGDTIIRSPFDGAVTEKQATVGQYLKENTPILTIVKTHPLRLRVALPETAAAIVKIGTSLSFTTDAAPGARFNAIVRELNPSLDAKSRTLTAEARPITNDPRLRPGMFVQVELVTNKGAEIVVVPKEAVYSVAGLTKVFVVHNGVVQEKRITTGQEFADAVEVPREAVAPGEQVAVSQLTQLTQGMPVRATPRS